jgi:hypothetical protein
VKPWKNFGEMRQYFEGCGNSWARPGTLRNWSGRACRTPGSSVGEGAGVLRAAGDAGGEEGGGTAMTALAVVPSPAVTAAVVRNNEVRR